MAQGERLGRYTLVEQIAVGGMAEIWLARMAGLEGFEKLVVIKKIKNHLAKESNFVQMFLNEARLAAQLNHPHIVQIYDLGKFGESYFIAMEYIFGRDLSEIAPKAEKKGIPFPFEYAIKIISQVCEGLYYAHCKTDALGNPLHIVHRDISPQNIFVSFDGNVKILDFGIAKAANQFEQTQEGTLKGKIAYMSPEQILGEPFDHRSDLFSLGVAFYELVTGYKLFSGDNELVVLKSIVDGPIYPPSYFKEDVPEALEHVILRALEKDPDKRYQSAWEMQQDLNQLLSSFKFNPSNIHLANFLKQLFEDEIERELRYLEKRIADVVAQEEDSGESFTEFRINALEDLEPLDEEEEDEPEPLEPEPAEETIEKLLKTFRSHDPSDTQPDLEALPEVPIPEDEDELDDPLSAHTTSPQAKAYPHRPLSAEKPSAQTPSTHQWVLRDRDQTRQDEYALEFEQEDPSASNSGLPAPFVEEAHDDEPGEDSMLDVSQILFTMRFRHKEYKELKRIASSRGESLEQLLRQLIRRGLPSFAQEVEEDLDPK